MYLSEKTTIAHNWVFSCRGRMHQPKLLCFFYNHSTYSIQPYFILDSYCHRYGSDRTIIDRVLKYLKVSMNYYEHHRLHTLFDNLNPTLKQDVIHDLCRDFFDKLPLLSIMPIGELT